MKFSNRLLSEVAFFQEGPGVRKFQFRNEGVKLLNVGNINKGVLDTSTTKLYISEEEAYGKYKHFLVDEGDLLIASSGIVVDNFHNKIAYVKKEHLPLCLNTSTIRFKTLDENVFSLDYLKFYLKTTHFKNQLRKLITGAAQLNFGPSHLKKITLPVPSLPDQLHIANLLSKAENLIAQRKESIRLVDEFLKSTFLEMFGDPVRNEKEWNIGKFKDLAILDRKQVLPSDFTKEDFYIGLEDIEKETGNIIKISSENAEDLKSSKFRFTSNHILYAKLRPYLNKVALPYQSGICSTDIFPVLPLEGKSNKFFICYLMRSKPFVTEMHSKSSGANLPRASASVIENFKTYQPPIKLQAQFAQIVEKTEALKTQYQQSLQKLENLYGSLSQKAFRGELSVK